MDKKNLLKQIQHLHQEQNWPQMVQVCTQGLKHFPKSASTYYNRAIAKAKLKCFKEARQDLKEALELRPSLKEANLLLQKLKQTNHSQLFEQEGTALKQLLTQDLLEQTNKIGRYEIVEEIGRGGMGCVYKAYDPKMNRYIALKTMLFLSSVKNKDILKQIVC